MHSPAPAPEPAEEFGAEVVEEPVLDEADLDAAAAAAAAAPARVARGELVPGGLVQRPRATALGLPKEKEGWRTFFFSMRPALPLLQPVLHSAEVEAGRCVWSQMGGRMLEVPSEESLGEVVCSK